ncbi:hypothetical protein BH24PSE2_BH24PSE2_04780 [soil metagenome]
MNVGQLAVTAIAATVAGCVVVVHPDDAEWGWEAGPQAHEVHEDEGRSPTIRKPGVAEAVARKFDEDELLGKADIEVTARDEVVSLHGRVPSRAHFDGAVDIASGTPGVAAVESRLTVEISGSAPEQEE